MGLRFCPGAAAACCLRLCLCPALPPVPWPETRDGLVLTEWPWGAGRAWRLYQVTSILSIHLTIASDTTSVAYYYLDLGLIIQRSQPSCLPTLALTRKASPLASAPLHNTREVSLGRYSDSAIVSSSPPSASPTARHGRPLR